MEREWDGQPKIGETARRLGVRPEIDIPIDDDGLVEPGDGGMSVTPDDPRKLPRHRRPPSVGGTGDDPLWELDSNHLPADLVYTEDNAVHGFIEPAYQMEFGDYQTALALTRDLWNEYGVESG